MSIVLLIIPSQKSHSGESLGLEVHIKTEDSSGFLNHEESLKFLQNPSNINKPLNVFLSNGSQLSPPSLSQLQIQEEPRSFLPVINVADVVADIDNYVFTPWRTLGQIIKLQCCKLKDLKSASAIEDGLNHLNKIGRCFEAAALVNKAIDQDEKSYHLWDVPLEFTSSIVKDFAIDSVIRPILQTIGIANPYILGASIVVGSSLLRNGVVDAFIPYETLRDKTVGLFQILQQNAVEDARREQMIEGYTREFWQRKVFEVREFLFGNMKYGCFDKNPSVITKAGGILDLTPTTRQALCYGSKNGLNATLSLTTNTSDTEFFLPAEIIGDLAQRGSNLTLTTLQPPHLLQARDSRMAIGQVTPALLFRPMEQGNALLLGGNCTQRLNVFIKENTEIISACCHKSQIKWIPFTLTSAKEMTEFAPRFVDWSQGCLKFHEENIFGKMLATIMQNTSVTFSIAPIRYTNLQQDWLHLSAPFLCLAKYKKDTLRQVAKGKSLNHIVEFEKTYEYCRTKGIDNLFSKLIYNIALAVRGGYLLTDRVCFDWGYPRVNAELQDFFGGVEFSWAELQDKLDAFRDEFYKNLQKNIEHMEFHGFEDAACAACFFATKFKDYKAASACCEKALGFDVKRGSSAQIDRQKVLRDLAICYSKLAEQNLQKKDAVTAKAYYEKLNNLPLPQDADILWGRIGLALELNIPQDAIISLKKITSLCPKNPDAFFCLGTCFSSQGNHGEACSALQTAIRLKPSLLPARKLLGDELLTLMRPEEAMVQYQEYLKQQKNAEQDFFRAVYGLETCYLQLATQELKQEKLTQGNFIKAEEYYKKATDKDLEESLKKGKTCIECQKMLTLLWLKTDVAIKLSMAPETVSLQSDAVTKLTQQVITFLEEITHLDARDANAFLNLGCFLSRQGNHKGAVDALRLANGVKPDDGKILRLYGDELAIDGNYLEAIIQYKKYLQVHPQDKVIVAKVDYIFYLDNYDKKNYQAIVDYASNKLQDTSTDVIALFFRANAYLASDVLRLAIVDFKKITVLEPENHEAWIGLGNSFIARGSIDDAISCYHKAYRVIKLKPQDASTLERTEEMQHILEQVYKTKEQMQIHAMQYKKQQMEEAFKKQTKEVLIHVGIKAGGILLDMGFTLYENWRHSQKIHQLYKPERKIYAPSIQVEKIKVDTSHNSEEVQRQYKEQQLVNWLSQQVPRNAIASGLPDEQHFPFWLTSKKEISAQQDAKEVQTNYRELQKANSPRQQELRSNTFTKASGPAWHF